MHTFGWNLLKFKQSTRMEKKDDCWWCNSVIFSWHILDLSLPTENHLNTTVYMCIVLTMSIPLWPGASQLLSLTYTNILLQTDWEYDRRFMIPLSLWFIWGHFIYTDTERPQRSLFIKYLKRDLFEIASWHWGSSFLKHSRPSQQMCTKTYFFQELQSHCISTAFCNYIIDVSNEESNHNFKTHLRVQEKVTVSRLSISSCPPNFLNVTLKTLSTRKTG